MPTSSPTIDHGVDLEVFRRYAGLSLPRHVSYPMPTWWKEIDAADAGAMLQESTQQTPGNDLSLYVHIPFCQTLCKFCACNRVIVGSANDDVAKRVDRYLDALEREIRSLSASIDAERPLRQIHWGGGSPTYLSGDQIERVFGVIADVFQIDEQAEIAMEIDPRGVSPEKLSVLKRLGFNRLSMGIQDFDRRTQEHVRRVQPFDLVRDVIGTCRELEFESINFDLIYGMPFQTRETIRDTVEKTISLGPNRVAFYHYAQIPEKIATQRGMDFKNLPDSEAKLEMFLIGLDLFEQAGYAFIGLDHFARADEALTKSLVDRTLQRNFQGMTTGRDLRLLGVGVSAISHLPGIGFLQSIKDTERYVALIDAGKSPVERGKRFTHDDLIRQYVIGDLYCQATIEPKTIERRFGIDFANYFAPEMATMEELSRDGLVSVGADDVIQLSTPLGRVLMRNVAAVFDAYLDKNAYREGARYCYSASA